MKTLNGSRLLPIALGGILLASAMTGCSLFNEDLPDCATPQNIHASVKFVYDYNTQATDLFNQNVGAVTLFVFDSQSGRQVRQIETTNFASGYALAKPGFEIALDQYNLNPGTYDLYAVGLANPGGYQDALRRPGAHWLMNTAQMANGTATKDDFVAALQNNSGIVPNDGVMLDTLYTTLSAARISIPTPIVPALDDPQPADVSVSATIPLMRVTKHLKVSFYQEDFPTELNVDNYDISVRYNPGSDEMNILGDYIASSSAITLTPYRTWNETRNGRAYGNMEIGLPRFIMANANSVSLIIRNKISGYTHDIKFINQCALGNAAFASYNWGTQEYLDREHDYDLEYTLTDTTWKYCRISVNILSWSMRVQNTGLVN